MAVKSWSAYVGRVANGLTQVQIAQKTGLAQTNVGRWLRGEPGAPKAESVIAFAKAFGQSPVEALMAAGYLDAADVSLPAPRPLATYSERDLLDELRSRHAD